MAGRAASQGLLDRCVAGIGAAAFALAIVHASPAAAESGQPMQLANVTVAQAPSRGAETDVFGRIARWFDRSVDDLNEGLKDALGGVEKFGGRTREAVRGAAKDVSNSAESLAALPDIRIVSQRVICPSAANGAPDCRRAAQSVCRRHGFASGKSFETRSEEKCSVPALLARRAGEPDTCTNETYVLRSVCQ